MKIMVVDDSLTTRKIIINCLHRLGFMEIVEAENGKRAFETLTQGSADLILTDWNMPEVSGLELVRMIRGQEDLKKTPILMITTNSAKDEVLEALRAGVNNYIVKPFTPETLKEKILSILPSSC